MIRAQTATNFGWLYIFFRALYPIIWCRILGLGLGLGLGVGVGVGVGFVGWFYIGFRVLYPSIGCGI